MKRIIIITILFFQYLFIARAQEIQVKAGFDSARIYIGDQIKFTVTVEKPQNLSLSLPAFKDTLTKNIEILKGPVPDSAVLGNGRVRIRHEYLITSFDTGFYQVSPVYAEIRTESGIKRYYSDYSWLEVMRVKISPPDTASAIFDIIDPGKVPLTASEIIPWILIMLAIAGALWLIFRLIKRFKKEKHGELKPVITEPAHVIAFRELEKLRDEKLWQRGEVKPYYSRLTEIIRQYIMNRYSVPALEMTTIETLNALLNNGIKEDESYRKLRTILTGGDLVKFAKYQPEPSENELHFEYAWDYVKSTIPAIQPEVVETKPADVKEEAI